MITTYKSRDIETKNGISIRTTRSEDFVFKVLPLLGQIEDMMHDINEGEGKYPDVEACGAIGDTLDDLAATTEQPSHHLVYAAAQFAYLLPHLLTFGCANKESIRIVLEHLYDELLNAISS